MTDKFKKGNFVNQWLPLGSLSIVWVQAQRPCDQKRVDRMAANFDPDYFGIILVAKTEDGRYHIVDGQHRVKAAIKVFGESQTVPCAIVQADTVKRAAEIFGAVNNGSFRKAPTAVAQFLVDVHAEKEDEVEVFKLVMSLGFKISTSDLDGHIRATKALLAVYRRHGKLLLLRTLTTIRATWGRDNGAYSGNIIQGMALLLDEFGDDIKTDRLVERLQKAFLPARLTGTAKSSQETYGENNMPRAVKRVLLYRYNVGLSASNKLVELPDGGRKSSVADHQEQLFPKAGDRASPDQARH